MTADTPDFRQQRNGAARPCRSSDTDKIERVIQSAWTRLVAQAALTLIPLLLTGMLWLAYEIYDAGKIGRARLVLADEKLQAAISENTKAITDNTRLVAIIGEKLVHYDKTLDRHENWLKNLSTRILDD